MWDIVEAALVNGYSFWIVSWNRTFLVVRLWVVSLQIHDFNTREKFTLASFRTHLGICFYISTCVSFSLLVNQHCVKSVQSRSIFWSLFSCIQSEYRKIRIRKNSVFRHFSRSANIYQQYDVVDYAIEEICNLEEAHRRIQ